MKEKLLVPDIEEFEGVEVIEILVQEGKEIKKKVVQHFVLEAEWV